MSTREHIVRAGQALGPLVDVAPARDYRDPGGPVYKPRGLWYGVDGGWREWCEGNMPHWIEGGEAYSVDLQDARILYIATLAELDQFHAEYFTPLTPDFTMLGSPDWQRLASEGYDGVEIAPYRWERRLENGFNWYYGWDCASGVVWSASKIRLVPVHVLA